MNKIIVRMVECTDSDIAYGFLLIESEKALTEKDVQDEIYKIKSTFADPDEVGDKEDVVTSGNYTVSDIIDRLPSDWTVIYYENAEVEV